MHKLEVLENSNSILAEGPFYHEKDKCLYFTDIKAFQIVKYSLEDKSIKRYQFDKQIGAFCFTNKNRVLAALQDGLYYLDLKNLNKEFLCNPEKDLITNRFNDGKCDIKGRFFVGSMDDKEEITSGSLYSYEKNNIKKLESNLSISNGLGWNKNNTKFYLTDSPKRVIYVYDYDVNTGNISNKKIFARIDEKDGYPDGLTLDDEDNIYSCHWAGFKITKYSSCGDILEIIDLPVPNVSSCCFGDNNYKTLLITTAKKGLSQEELDKYPQSGYVFSLKLNVSGQKSNLFQE